MLTKCVQCLVVSYLIVLTWANEDTGWTCEVSGTRYKEGENFTTSLAGPCVVFQCSGGSAKVVKQGCHRDGQCMDVGHVWNHMCLTYTCTSHNGAIGVNILKGGCMAGSTCVGVNEIYSMGCFNYTCLQKDHRLGPTFRLLLKEWGCNYKGKCVPSNYTVTENCNVQRCEMHNQSVGMYDLKEACMNGNGGCVQLGETVHEKCRSFTCKQQQFLGIKVYSLDLDSALCEDAEGKCHGEGEKFNMRFNNDIIHGCSCTLNGANPHYSCGNNIIGK